AAAGFAAVAVDVRKPGFASLHAGLARVSRALVLVRTLPVVGSVSVATGSSKSLHEVPLATSVLDRSAVALAPAATTDRLLRELPGNDRTRSNSAFTNYGQLRASFSGAGNDRGDVLVDGVPAQDGFGGQVGWLAYPAQEIERIELLRGAGSALYGSGAVGGVLDIDTFGPRVGSAASGRAGLGIGTNRSSDETIQFRTPLGPYFGGSISAVSTRMAYFDLPPGYSAPSDHISTGDTGTTHLRARYQNGSTTIDGALLAASDHQDEGRANYAFDRTLKQESFAVTQSLGAVQARFGAYVRDTSVYNLADLFPSEPGQLRYDQHVPTDESGFFGTLGASSGPFDFELIVDQRRIIGSSVQTGPTGRLQSLGIGNEIAQGAGVQAAFHTRRFEALAGARADRERYDDLGIHTVTAATPAPVIRDVRVPGHADGAVSPRVALRYDLTPKLAVRASSGGGFRAPYLNELVRSFNVAAVVMAPNPNLTPERSITSVAGLDYAFGPGRLSFDITETRVHDAIDFVTLSKTLMMRENVDRTQTDGETLTYAQSVGQCARVRVSGTTQNPRITSGPPGTSGKQLEYVPDRSISVGFESTGPGPLAFSVDSSYVGQTYADELETEPLGAALLFGATIRA
ncbi:MAG: TonB-dependent receptor, partial [Candidatus Eremiobacteraeota bacterium]|nr:TonB-dependent receptor [Candidatus Eremiobacteraeota bacterium]